jgi:hypothetical protein
MSAYPMDADRLVGDGGGVTIYQRPDGSRYALDRHGRGHELCFGEGAIGPARFDARAHADGVWPGSRSRPAVAAGRRPAAPTPAGAASRTSGGRTARR